MSLAMQTHTVVIVTLALYCILPFWLFLRNGPLLAGGIQFLVAFLPGIAQGVLWPDSAGNFGLLMMILVPLPLILIFASLAMAFLQFFHWLVGYLKRQRFTGPSASS